MHRFHWYLLPSRQQWKRWSLPSKLTAVGVFIGVVSVLLSILFFTLPHALPPSQGTALIDVSPIVASPTRLSLGDAQHKSASLQFRFHNRSDAILYDAWVKITIYSDSITYGDLFVRFDNAPSKHLIWRLSAIDPRGNKAEYFLLHEVPPHSTYLLSLADTRTSPLSPSPHFLTAEVLGFSSQPQRLQKRMNPEDFLHDVVVPEDIQLMRLWAHYPLEQDLKIEEILILDQSEDGDAQR